MLEVEMTKSAANTTFTLDHPVLLLYNMLQKKLG